MPPSDSRSEIDCSACVGAGGGLTVEVELLRVLGGMGRDPSERTNLRDASGNISGDLQAREIGITSPFFKNIIKKKESIINTKINLFKR